MKRAITGSAPTVVPSSGKTSSVGPTGAAPKPRVKNTRDYPKKGEPAGSPPAPEINPFGSVRSF